MTYTLLTTALFTAVLAPTRGAVFATVATLSLASALLLQHWAAERPERRPVAMGWTALVCAHVVLGMGLDLYESSALYDKLVHVAAFAWVAAVLPAELRARFPLQALFAAIGLGAGWELFEFAADHGGWFVAQKGLDDTMLDLACDALGAGVGLGLSGARAPQETL